MPQPRIQVDALAFDLLTALLDSWSLWTAVAGDEELGRSWRTASLRLVTGAGDYTPYEAIVEQAAQEVDLPAGRAWELMDRWAELRPWPEAPEVLERLRGRRLAIVTNCSQRLAEIGAAVCLRQTQFELVMSAERAGAYKPDPRPYRAALAALGLPPERVLFVAGSAHDVPGALGVGMPVYWSNRQRQPVTAGAEPLVDAPDLTQLPDIFE